MQTREIEWDADALSREFLAKAEGAERYLNEVQRKLRVTKSYELIYDQTLAEFYVFNYLHGRRFLATRELLLAALRDFLAFDVPKPPQVFDFERFKTFRKNIAERLVERFQKGK